MKIPRVIAYGFDQQGFALPQSHSIKTERANISFLSMETSKSIDNCEGVIFHSGLFEKFRTHEGYDSISVDVICKRDFLLQRERETYNLLKKGGWICCLVSKIIDDVPAGSYQRKKCDDTDLAKRILNDLGVKREAFQGSVTSCTSDEFRPYIEKYGVAKTILRLQNENLNSKVLAKVNNKIVGLEFAGQIFFLPFHSTDFSFENADLLASELTKAILDYRLKRLIEIPDWVDKFAFNEEITLKSKKQQLIEEISTVEDKLSLYKSYKGVLTQSGDGLKDTVVNILKNFFSLNVTDVEDFKEDALVRDSKGKILIVIEIKGTNGGVRRKHINQLDDNRERIELTPSTPGLLIINDHMNVEDAVMRQESSVAEEIAKHAMNTNVIILRTSDLLYYMKSVEKTIDRGQDLIDRCSRGGGIFDPQIA